MTTTTSRTGFHIDVSGVSRRARGGHELLSDVSFSIEPGELVAIIGGSGAGKTTLLEAIAGVRLPDGGSVSYGGADLATELTALRGSFGYVPQDDIIHRELPLVRTLRYAARLRLPGLSDARREQRVRETLAALDLADRAEVRVADLSGGQRRRASIGVELLTRPRVFFLDEPTSGLDPATQAELMRLLRRLADEGRTVLLTTHAPENLRACDKVVVLAPGGRLAFCGTPRDALAHFGVDDLADIYAQLTHDRAWAPAPVPAPRTAEPVAPTPTAGFLRQWRTLSRRNLDVLGRSRVTLAILIGSPVMVVFMLAALFRPGAFDASRPDPAVQQQLVYWIAFGGFFFGLTYGLLQIVGEFPIFRRERLANVGIAPYVLAKLTVLLPFLLLVDVAMLGVLRMLDRLPAVGAGTYLSLGTSVLLDAVAALALGLLASALVSDSAQATIALPVLCWPQVLFAGALVPVPRMALPGRLLSYPISDRWAFEALGRDVGAATGPVVGHWGILGGFTLAGLAATCLALRRRASVTGR